MAWPLYPRSARPTGPREAISPSSHKQDVVAQPAVQHIDASTTDQHVVAGAAEQRLISHAADEHVIAIAAVENELRPAKTDARRQDHVVTAKAVDADRVVEIEVIDHDAARKPVDHQRTVLVERE